MANWTAFLDDSATQLVDGSVSTVAVGVVAAPDEVWEPFSAEWSKMLGGLGIERWHATDASALAGEFSTCTPVEVAAAYAEFDRAVARVSELVSLAYLLDRRDFETLSPTARARFGSAYGLACHMAFGALGHALKISRIDETPSVMFVVDRPGGRAGFGQMQRLFDEMLRLPEIQAITHAKGLRPGNNRDDTPLQLADVVVHDVRRGYERSRNRIEVDRFSLPSTLRRHVFQKADADFMARVSKEHEGAVYYLDAPTLAG